MIRRFFLLAAVLATLVAARAAALRELFAERVK